MGVLSNGNEQQFKSRGERKTTSKLSALKTLLVMNGFFNDTSVLSITRVPAAVDCAVSGKVNGGAGSRCGATGLDEMNSETIALEGTGPNMLTRAAVSIPARTPRISRRLQL